MSDKLERDANSQTKAASEASRAWKAERVKCESRLRRDLMTLLAASTSSD